MMKHLMGAVEAGGTKFVCAVGSREGKIEKRDQFPTGTPEKTMEKVCKFFERYDVEAIGIGSFGPIDADSKSPTYGYIKDTPKLLWRNYDFLGAMRKHCDVPYVWTTDVNVAAYGEYKLGAGRGMENVCYVTVGTGVGVGYVSHGNLYCGRSNPESGHILLHRFEGDRFEGNCEYHGDCIEGLTSGTAIEKRTGRKAFELPENDFVWKIEAYYLAQACMDYTLTFSPDIIILGGGVMKQEQLFPMIRREFLKLLNGYVIVPDVDKYIVHVKLGDDAGITGSLLAAADICKN